MTATDPVTAPKPVSWYRWAIYIVMGAGWTLIAWMIAIDKNSVREIVLVQVSWFMICLVLAGIGVFWFRIELRDQGVTKRGLFHKSYIAWSEATLERIGYTAIISSKQESIKLNAYIYKNPDDLFKFLTRHLP
jgi:hypothetical protein